MKPIHEHPWPFRGPFFSMNNEGLSLRLPALGIGLKPYYNSSGPTVPANAPGFVDSLPGASPWASYYRLRFGMGRSILPSRGLSIPGFCYNPLRLIADPGFDVFLGYGKGICVDRHVVPGQSLYWKVPEIGDGVQKPEVRGP